MLEQIDYVTVGLSATMLEHPCSAASDGWEVDEAGMDGVIVPLLRSEMLSSARASLEDMHLVSW
jgi:hypothetical protein